MTDNQSTPNAPSTSGSDHPTSPTTTSGGVLSTKDGYVIPICIILPAIALFLSSFALWLVCTQEPLGKGLKAYDLSTPSAAFKSQMRMRLDTDIKAERELWSITHGGKVAEKLETLQVVKEVVWQGRVLLFVSYRDEGVKKYEVKSCEKDAKSGMWSISHISGYTVEKDSPRLAKEIDSWRQQDGK